MSQPPAARRGRAGRPSRLAGVSGERQSAWNLALATAAFTLCFAAWSLISPFAKSFKTDLGLSYTEALLLTAVPVVLGSLLRVPMAVLFGYADGYWALIGVGFLLGVAGSSFAVGVPFVAGWYSKEQQGFALGLYGMGNVGTAVAFFGAPPLADHWGRPTLGWVTGLALLAGGALFLQGARNAPRKAPAARYGAVVRSGWRLYRLAFFYFITFGGFVAMFL